MRAERGAAARSLGSRPCAFLRAEGREDAFRELSADPDAAYDVTDTVDLSALQPLIARPSSPGNVVAVRDVAGEPVSQVVIGSSANPGLRDFAIAAAIVADRQTSEKTTSRTWRALRRRPPPQRWRRPAIRSPT